MLQQPDLHETTGIVQKNKLVFLKDYAESAGTAVHELAVCLTSACILS